MSSLSPSSPTSAPTAQAIAADTSLGAVSLTVSDLARSRAFYETALGLSVREIDDGDLAFGVPGAGDLVRLHGDPSAPALDRRACTPRSPTVNGPANEPSSRSGSVR